MAITPNEFSRNAEPILREEPQSTKEPWIPIVFHDCQFGTDDFERAMMNLVHNPNINSTWLFRADVLYDDEETKTCQDSKPRVIEFSSFHRWRTLVRKLIPRNERRDKPLDQTCIFYRAENTRSRPLLAESLGEEPGKDEQQARSQCSLVVYVPHVSSVEEMPFYHPAVQALGYLHKWDPVSKKGTISVHYRLFPHAGESPAIKPLPERLQRTAAALLKVLHKHGTGNAAGYIKRVQHDVVVPQVRLQTRYAELKQRHAAGLVRDWAEVTDPTKHVFEDLGIAAFLIELWVDMYAASGRPFPGFVDIGCGNGLLVHILNAEGYTGWGFDARTRKSWSTYCRGPTGRENLRERILVPWLVHGQTGLSSPDSDQKSPLALPPEIIAKIHPGTFPEGTFMISNHADELTPWTPILAAHSRCPFVMIPCCSFNLAGQRFRAPQAAPGKQKLTSSVKASSAASTYSSFVHWVTDIAIACGFETETEVLRIPSTRNNAIIGVQQKLVRSPLRSLDSFGNTPNRQQAIHSEAHTTILADPGNVKEPSNTARPPTPTPSASLHSHDQRSLPPREVLTLENTRNTAILAREPAQLEDCVVDLEEVVERFGGIHGYADNLMNMLQREYKQMQKQRVAMEKGTGGRSSDQQNTGKKQWSEVESDDCEDKENVSHG